MCLCVCNVGMFGKISDLSTCLFMCDVRMPVCKCGVYVSAYI